MIWYSKYHTHRKKLESYFEAQSKTKDLIYHHRRISYQKFLSEPQFRLANMSLQDKRKCQVAFGTENKKRKMEEEKILTEYEDDSESDDILKEVVENKAPQVLPSWREVESLPPGWKLREMKAGGKSLQYIMSPQAKIFPCRRLALRHLLGAVGREKEVEMMREKLEHEGWQQSDHLPDGWRYKQGSAQSVELLTEKCNILKSFKDAAAHLEESNTSQDKMNKFKIFEKSKQCRTDGKKKELKDSKLSSSLTLPQGWKSRLSGDREYVISPEGALFKSSRLALKEMVKRALPEDDLAKMRQSMSEWSQHELLPKNWLYKVIQKKEGIECIFLSENGDWVRGGMQAIQLLEVANKCDEKDISNLNKFLCDLTKSARKQRMETSTNISKDKLKALELPEGWKSRDVGSKQFIISPEGEQFVNVRLALKGMVRKALPESDLMKVRTYFANSEGWETSENLPPGWMFKYERVSYPSKESGAKVQFLTSCGELLKSLTSAVKFMEESVLYGDEQIQAVNSLITQETLGWRKSMSQKITTSLNLPPGWKSRSVGSRDFVVSPEGEQFNTTRLALKEMVRRGVNVEALRRLRESMAEREGWEESGLLPENWMFKYERYKTQNRDHSRVIFLTSEGELIHSFLNAIKSMESNSIYDSDDLANLNNFMKETTKTWRKANINEMTTGLQHPEGWKTNNCGNNEDDLKTQLNLPDGWKTRICGNKDYVVSPEGEQYNSSRIALVEMVKRGLPEEQLARMRESMKEWSSSELLPKNWMFKFQRRKQGELDQVIFLMENGQCVRGGTGAIKTLEESEIYQEEDITNINIFLQDSAKLARKGLVDELESLTRKTASLVLPEGWKSRMVGSKEYVISPEGDQFNSSRIALIEMVKREMPEEDLVNLRQSMSEWSSSDLLPKNWMYKFQSRKDGELAQVVFLTAIGQCLRGGTQAIKELEDSKIYQGGEITNLNIFLQESAKLIRKSNVEEEADLTENHASLVLPEGWKSRMVGSKEYVISPEGDQFNSSRIALIEMVKRGMSEEILVNMRQSMSEWSLSELLPKNWMYKIVYKKERNKDGIECIFLTENGDWVRGGTQAIQYLENSQLDKEEDMQNFNTFLRDISKNARKNRMEATLEEETGETSNSGESLAAGLAPSLLLPEGWKSRLVGTKEYVVSPDGDQFSSSKLALQEMVRRGVNEDDLARMRSSMREWKTSELLPPKWLYKTVKKEQNYEFLSETAEHIRGKLKALELIKDLGEEAVETFQVFSEIASAKTRGKAYEWSEDDKTIPVGWKSRLGGHKTYFLSPEGQQFPNRVAILQFMINEGYEDSMIDEMRSNTIYEGWQESQYLPNKWIFRHTWNQSTLNAYFSFCIKILSEDGHLMDSYLAARTFMKFSENFSFEDVEKIDILVEENAKLRRLSAIQDEPANKTDEQEIAMHVKWQDDVTLPEGWKTKLGGNKNFFLSPQGQKFPNRVAVLQYMINEGYDDSVIDVMRSTTTLEGWQESQYLPKNWIIKHSWSTSTSEREKKEGMRNRGKETSFSVKILSGEGHLMDSYLASSLYMKQNNKFNKDDLDNLSILIEENAKLRRISKFQEEEDVDITEVVADINVTGWTKSENLPAGWKVKRAAKKEQQHYLSPNGDQFHGVAALFRHIVTSGASAEEEHAVRMELEEEGWTISKHFPSDWVVKHEHTYLKSGSSKKKIRKLDILSPDGNRFKSYLAAARFMQIGDNYSDQDVEKVKALISHNSVTGPATHGDYGKVREDSEISGWTDDDTLPPGWKVKTLIKGKSGHLMETFLAPSGQQLVSRHSALTLLASQGGSEAEVANMRRGLKKFGWEEEPFLPPGWLKKEGDQRPMFYSPDNRKFDGPCALLDHLLTEGHGFQVSW